MITAAKIRRTSKAQRDNRDFAIHGDMAPLSEIVGEECSTSHWTYRAENQPVSISSTLFAFKNVLYFDFLTDIEIIFALQTILFTKFLI
ncbi:MAG: hypothetical protein KF734_04175 [Saprospiraceae bacterium]|nr:hypothetical protein [Saprospiraceae bacterium]